MTRKRKPTADPTVTFWGAARTVTGSMHQVDACGKTLLLDCGLFQGRRAESRRRNREFPFRPKDIDAVLLSHAHIDHCGNLPNLVTPGLRRPDLLHARPPAPWRPSCSATPPRSRRKTPPISIASARRASRRSSRCTTAATSTARCCGCKAVPYDTPFDVGRGLEATFVDAGHLLGSAMIRLRMDGAGRRAAADVHRRPGPAGAADPARPGPGPAGRPAHQRKHLRRPHARAGRGDGRAAGRGGAAHGRSAAAR